MSKHFSLELLFLIVFCGTSLWSSFFGTSTWLEHRLSQLRSSAVVRVFAVTAAVVFPTFEAMDGSTPQQLLVSHWDPQQLISARGLWLHLTHCPNMAKASCNALAEWIGVIFRRCCSKMADSPPKEWTVWRHTTTCQLAGQSDLLKLSLARETGAHHLRHSWWR